MGWCRVNVESGDTLSWCAIGFGRVAYPKPPTLPSILPPPTTPPQGARRKSTAVPNVAANIKRGTCLRFYSSLHTQNRLKLQVKNEGERTETKRHVTALMGFSGLRTHHALGNATQCEASHSFETVRWQSHREHPGLRSDREGKKILCTLKRKPATAKGGRPLLGGTAAAKGRYIWSSQEWVHDVDDPSGRVNRTAKMREKRNDNTCRQSTGDMGQSLNT